MQKLFQLFRFTCGNRINLNLKLVKHVPNIITCAHVITTKTLPGGVVVKRLDRKEERFRALVTLNTGYKGTKLGRVLE